MKQFQSYEGEHNEGGLEHGSWLCDRAMECSAGWLCDRSLETSLHSHDHAIDDDDDY